jgi:hypothetical protein
MAVTLGQVRNMPKFTEFTAERSLHKTAARCSYPKSGGCE